MAWRSGAWAELGSGIQCMRLCADGLAGSGDAWSGGLRLGRVGQRHPMHAFERGWFGGRRGNALLPMHARTGAGRVGIMEADACAAAARMNRLETAARSGGLARNGVVVSMGRARGPYKIERWKKPGGEFRPANGSIAEKRRLPPAKADH